MSKFTISKKVFYLFSLPVLLAFFFELLSNTTSLNPLYNALENSLFSIVIISPIHFICQKKYQSIYLIITYFLFCFFLFFESVYYHLFESYFSSSVIFILLDSNISEASEFLNFYISKSVVLYGFLMLLISFFSFFKIRSFTVHQKINDFGSRVIVVIISAVIVVFLKFSSIIVYNLPYLFIKSYIEYSVESKKLGDYKLNPTGDFNNVKRVTDSLQDEVYVLILGESSTRAHMGIYDYNRQTTPKLTKLRKELLIYNDVISPHAFSIGSITKSLTLGNYESNSDTGSGSIIQLANNTNFDTTWLSNQRPIGVYESLITKISLSSNSPKFLTATIARHNKTLDEDLLPALDRVLISNKHPKKFIVVHLIGSHLNYKNRYPNSFNIFKDKPSINFPTQENFDTTNQYDNTILYTDFMVSEIIKKIDALNTKSFVLFLSDHGEELFNDLNMAGHNEDTPTKNMFDIPFLLWRSDKYKKDKLLSIDFDRKYMIDDLFHSIADLLEISAQEVDSTRSIFNKKFKDRKRIILKSVEYDTFFK